MGEMEYRSGKRTVNEKDDRSPSIGLWLIGLFVGAGLMVLTIIVFDFIMIAFEPDRDVMKWLFYVQMVLWVIGSVIASLSAILPGFLNRSLHPSIRGGLIIAGVLGLFWALNYANNIVPYYYYY
jgi:hypothetical protein